MQEATRGVAAMLGAATIWGLSPLYYKLLAEVPPGEVLAHRTLWSLVFFAGVLALGGRLREMLRILIAPRLAGPLLVTALLISTNWFLFILSIQIERATMASLGYYMFPLVAVLLGVLVFGERLGRIKLLAVALAAAAVVLLSLTAGQPPWISLILATTFGLYGMVKKRISVNAVTSVTVEVALLTPLALLWLGLVHADAATGAASGAVFGRDAALSLLLMASGPLTAAPLILFSYASQRAALSTVGLIQYLNPTLQFLCAVLIFREPFAAADAFAFLLIWTALALYTAASLAQQRSRRRAARSASIDGQKV
ncbi:EamA family transporter RarD [Roseivivax sp. CAU 1761]